ncbi:MAG TPA: hypothetical protein VKM72_12230 [Thermoanaerobaculia bacterium]|nr:hypothetical protein [Thermoanaerobaculia bacterium]
MLPPDNPSDPIDPIDDPIHHALLRILPILGPIFDVFEVPLHKRQEVVAQARLELVIKHPDLFHTAEPWLLRRILRICTEEEANLFWGDGEIPEELLFEAPPFFRKHGKNR